MSEKLHNEEFDVKRVDGNVLSGDSNKIKLKITSYAVILEVQETYMQEEIAAKEQERKDLEQKLESEELSRKEKREIKKDLSLLNGELDILNDVFLEFSESRKRFMEIAKKALKLPEENLKELAETGWLEIEDKKVNIDTEYENIQNKLMDAQDEENVFTSVDTDAIREAVDQTMSINELEEESENYKDVGDYISQNVTSDIFDDLVSVTAGKVKRVVDYKKANELTEEDVAGIFANASTVLSEEPETKDEETTNGFRIFGSGDERTTERPPLRIDIPSSASETSEWKVQPTNDDNKTFEGFDKDKSIEELVQTLEKRNESLKTHGEELNSKLSDVKGEQTEATRKKEQAIKAREEAKKRADDVKRQIELFNSYKPKMDELRKANEEQEKLNSDKEEELRKENEALAAINSETTTIETETDAYNEETSKALEELKKLRAEFAGTGYPSSGDFPLLGVEGGRKK